MVSVKTFEVMCDQTLFLGLQTAKSDIRSHIKWAISMDGHLILPGGRGGLCGMYGLIYSLYHP